MTRLLHISASPRHAASISRQVAGDLIAALRGIDPELDVTERDLATEPLPHVDAAFTQASLRPEADHGPAEREALALSERLIAELMQADIIALSSPMHNFAAPSSLKAWIDHIARPGRTFRLTQAGKRGLLADRPVFVMITCGGHFAAGDGAQPDFLGPHLRYLFGIIGLTKVELLRLEGLARGDEAVTAARDTAREWIAMQAGKLGLARRREDA